jgi:hypothetical protein
MRAFFDDMFDFEKMSTLSKDALVYPAFTGLTAEDAREQTLRTIVDHLIAKKGDYRDLYTTRTTFLSPPLAALYQLPTAKGWVEYKFPENSQRSGLLTHISFLSAHSHPLENPKSEHKTQRDRVSFHLENPVCAGCHRITDPIGLAMENFDGSGRYRTTERGATIDPSGNLDGKKFSDVVGLAQALHDHPSLTSCLVKRVYSYGTGSQTTNDDAEVLKFLNARFESAGYRVPDLLRTIALSKSFAEFKVEAASAESKTAQAPSAEPTAK